MLFQLSYQEDKKNYVSQDDGIGIELIENFSMCDLKLKFKRDQKQYWSILLRTFVNVKAWVYFPLFFKV